MHYVLRQEIVLNIWFLIFIYACSHLALKLRQKNSYFTPRYFACLYEIFRKKKYYFILLLILWLSNFLINIMYIVLFGVGLYEIYYLSTAYFFVGAFFGFLPLTIACFFIHFEGRVLVNDKDSARFRKFNRRIFLIWFIIAAIIDIGVILIVFYTTRNCDITALISSITHIIILISMIIYYNMKLKRELIYLSFKKIVSGDIKNIDDWISFLHMSERQTINCKEQINKWSYLYGFEVKLE